jgi:hypothetical protein
MREPAPRVFMIATPTIGSGPEEATAVSLAELSREERADLEVAPFPVPIEPLLLTIGRRLPSVPRWQLELVVAEELRRHTDAKVLRYVAVLVERAVLVRFRTPVL